MPFIKFYIIGLFLCLNTILFSQENTKLSAFQKAEEQLATVVRSTLLLWRIVVKMLLRAGRLVRTQADTSNMYLHIKIKDELL